MSTDPDTAERHIPECRLLAQCNDDLAVNLFPTPQHDANGRSGIPYSHVPCTSTNIHLDSTRNINLTGYMVVSAIGCGTIAGSTSIAVSL